METNTSDGGPGTGPPKRGELGIGKASEYHKDLYWPRLVAEYKKETSLRTRGSESALRVSLSVGHAPDDHTPYAKVDWGDPMDVRGAIKFAQGLVEDGGARYSDVRATVSRPTGRRVRQFVYVLASFTR